MHKLNLKQTHKPVKEYYEALAQFKSLRVSHEMAVRDAFQDLLKSCGAQFGWTLVPEWQLRRPQARALRVDGALLDGFRLAHGYWEAKDGADDLPREARKKLDLGYPSDNIIFQAPERAILWQGGREVADEDITDAGALVKILTQFFDYQPPAYEQWEQAVEDFQTELPELGRALTEQIEKARKKNERFREAFAGFYELCRQSINPNLSEQAVEEMLIQHILTERIFRTVFKNSDFTRRNVIAHEIEKVIDALTAQAFSREEFLRRFDHFYRAIEQTAATIEDFGQKQEFLNSVYEKFFQGFSVKVADTHGIVYTPQPIVNFMVKSVADILRREFGKSLGSKDVHILDPFVGTGNFIVRVMQEIKRTELEHKYKHELHCNEVMLLPYYIASMNIEHEFYELTGAYEPFEGICLVDTFELAEAKQISFFSTENTERVERQKRSPITVVIGNPPYNTAQLNENDNNKNRKYKVLDKRVSETYAKDSKATLLNKLNDPYVKAIRWATDRIGAEGVVALVTNSGFIDQIAFDGVRAHLEKDFDEIYILDLGGNVRKNPKLSGTTHNVFGIQVGVSINLFVRRRNGTMSKEARIYYARVAELMRKEEKYKYLETSEQRGQVEWQKIHPDDNHNWLMEGIRTDFNKYIPLGNKQAKLSRSLDTETLFKIFSAGVNTARDFIVYDFDKDNLLKRVEQFCEDYNSEVHRYLGKDEKTNLDTFLKYDKIKWSRNLKRHLKNQKALKFDPTSVRVGIYRPFTKKHLYFNDIIIDELSKIDRCFPTQSVENENRMVCVPSIGGRTSFWCYCINLIPNLSLNAVDINQCFPFYTYNEDGTNRRENITDWALEQFRKQYGDASISKWDIFHYVYAVLHHPAYRERYAANLKRELPRVPFAPDFRAFAEAGARLAEIHVNYERQPEYPLERIENRTAALDWRVERMKLSKDKRTLQYNDFLTLDGIPAEAFDYRLGNRSALEWVVDQYQVSTDRRSGITNDPNRADDPQYIVRLVAQVITVSLETREIVNNLPELGVGAEGSA